jgi:hypothetical protein
MREAKSYEVVAVPDPTPEEMLGLYATYRGMGGDRLDQMELLRRRYDTSVGATEEFGALSDTSNARGTLLEAASYEVVAVPDPTPDEMLGLYAIYRGMGGEPLAQMEALRRAADGPDTTTS